MQNGLRAYTYTQTKWHIISNDPVSQIFTKPGAKYGYGNCTPSRTNTYLSKRDAFVPLRE